MTGPLDLVVRGGTVVDADREQRLDVGIRGGTVVALGEGLPAAATEIDATGTYVLPGGVDVHTHLDQVSAKGARTADDFLSGSVSAAHGGTTTVMAFAAQARGERIADVLARGLAAASRSTVDVGLHLIVTDIDRPDAAGDLAEAATAGVTSMKVFMTYEKLRLADAALLRALAAARDLGVRVMVHAEHHGMIGYRTGTLVADGVTAPAGHLLAHSRNAEGAAVAEIAAIAEYLDMPIYIVHLSSPEGLRALRQARDRGVAITAETCPHYLFLDETRLDAGLVEAVRSMCSPPLRGAADRATLWAAVQAGDIDLIASDHAPYRMDAKLPRGSDTTFPECANGIAGVELRLPLMVSEALSGGRVSLPDVVRLCCAAPAQAMGLWPRKGHLGVGADADLAVWDPSASWVVSADGLHDAMDHSAYEGTAMKGAVRTVVSAGEVIVDDGGHRLTQGRGQFLVRPALPAGVRP
ncbi:dihydropyrimidinase [Nakamurella alba]|uniref:dihydropyrimidinase n=1 Tax=Nakamurella alba TaxID=2665158 RepID=UPI0018ABF8A3|nr:dihydropyrimidinase [Nakamurella alba]